jgi:hypothetical protein
VKDLLKLKTTILSHRKFNNLVVLVINKEILSGLLVVCWVCGKINNHDQICSNQALLSIIQGSEDVRAHVRRWHVTG